MNLRRPKLLLTIAFALLCGTSVAQDQPGIDPDAAFREKLHELVKAGKLAEEDAAELAATMGIEEYQEAKKQSSTDWEAEYEKLISDASARQWIEKKGVSKAEVIEYLKKRAASKNGKGKAKTGMKPKAGARPDSIRFYALVIGRLKSKDIELGEMEIDVDYVISDRPKINSDLVGKRVKLVGVSGQFLDSLLQIRRGETVKVRTGDLNPETKVLGFGYKFHVLERTEPFQPGDFGVPPREFRGFRGELAGKIVEATGYEVLLDVQECNPTEESGAKDDECIVGKRIRIAGFYAQHADAYADLRQGDRIRLSVTHRNPESDAINVTDKLESMK